MYNLPHRFTIMLTPGRHDSSKKSKYLQTSIFAYMYNGKHSTTVPKSYTLHLVLVQLLSIVEKTYSQPALPGYREFKS